MSYFDHNATTPLHPAVKKAMVEALQSDWANPSAPYRFSAGVRAKIERAREEVAGCFSADPSTLLFTSGATEAINTFLFHNFQTLDTNKKILISPFEHPAVLETAEFWFKKRVDYMPLSDEGDLLLDQVKDLVANGDYGLVCLMAANNETGVLQPWEELSLHCAENGTSFFCDATQWVGKLDANNLHQCSAYCFSAHKFGGPKGIGVLFSKEEVCPLIHGGTQENHLRAGTENFPSMEGLRIACQQCLGSTRFVQPGENGRDHFEEQLITTLPGIRIVGQGQRRLWNTSLLVMPKFNNLSWVEKMDKLGYQISTGAACSLDKSGARRGLAAFGLSEMDVRQLIRVSSFWSTGQKDWAGIADAFVQAYQEMEKDAGQSGVISI